MNPDQRVYFTFGITLGFFGGVLLMVLLEWWT